MIVLGIGGGLDVIHENKYNAAHDSTAVLIVNGKVVAAIEEERLNRIKHTDKAPLRAVRAVLDIYGITFAEIDKIAVYGQESMLNYALRKTSLDHLEDDRELMDTRTLIRTLLELEFQITLNPNVFEFVPHHLAHAMSAYGMSGYKRSLVLTMDGVGDGVSTMVLSGEGNNMEVLKTFYQNDSIGFFYVEVIKFLGYDMFDEYKVMGLSPYGDPRKYQRIFKKFYSLTEDGSYKIHFDRIDYLFEICPPRKKHEPFNQIHKDIAAALQESLEKIVFHILEYYRKSTGHTHLTMAGGVAHNCSLNGKILYSGLFEEMFVQPISHDAGAALGAAMTVYQSENPDTEFTLMDNLYLGTDIGDEASQEDILQGWSNFIDFKKQENICLKAAELISSGKVVAWVQGRSEFGPRALGNRSILADPRPAENKEIINAMVKMREGYRPFAPSILEEDLCGFFVVPEETKADFGSMTYVILVQEDKRGLLGAVTHVDGTARIQTVSKKLNSRYWQLINHFKKLSGIPIVLNTSFNNNVEPIVNSVYDAIVSYLTTNIHFLIIGDYLIQKKDIEESVFYDLIIKLKPSTILKQQKQHVSPTETDNYFYITTNYSPRKEFKISKELFELLDQSDGVKTFRTLLEEGEHRSEEYNTVLNELRDVWRRRLIDLYP